MLITIEADPISDINYRTKVGWVSRLSIQTAYSQAICIPHAVSHDGISQRFWVDNRSVSSIFVPIKDVS